MSSNVKYNKAKELFDKVEIHKKGKVFLQFIRNLSQNELDAAIHSLEKENEKLSRESDNFLKNKEN